MKCLDSIIDSMDMSLSKLREIVKAREAWCAPVHEVVENWTQLSDRTTTAASAATLYPSEILCKIGSSFIRFIRTDSNAFLFMAD